MIAATCARSKAAPRLKKSRSPVPSTYSMTMNALSSSSPYSYTLTMFGCSSRPAARASFLNRAIAEHAVDAVFPYGCGVSHGCTSALEHLDRLHHAGLHSPQRLGQNTDFV